jgi:serine/threonine protein kinase
LFFNTRWIHLLCSIQQQFKIIIKHHCSLIVAGTSKYQASTGGRVLFLMVDNTWSGKLIDKQLGDYKIISVLAAGGMAKIYRAVDVQLDREVAVKVLSPAMLDADTTLSTRFQREARAVAKLEHDNIIPIYRAGREDDFYYLAMKLIEGGDLATELNDLHAQFKLIDTKRMLLLMGQVAAALDHAHSAGIIHRDVKPSNILIEHSGKAILTDFGLVLNADLEKTMGTAFGTPRYISPEQALASEKAVPQSDIYSLAVIVYEAVTGSMVFKAETPMQIALSHISEPPPPPTSVNADIPPAVEKEILKALAKDPEKRHATVSEFVSALKAAYGDKAGASVNEISKELSQSLTPILTSPPDFEKIAEEQGMSVIQSATPQPILHPDTEEAAESVPLMPLSKPWRLLRLIMAWTIVACLVLIVVSFTNNNYLADFFGPRMTEIAGGDPNAAAHQQATLDAELAATDQQAATEQQTTLDAELAATDQQATSNAEQAATEQQATLDAEQAATEQQATSDAEQAATEQQATSDAEQAATEQQATSDAEQAATEQQATSDAEQVATDVPTTTDEATTTGEATATDVPPTATDDATATDEATATEEPTATNEATATDEPPVTDVPTAVPFVPGEEQSVTLLYNFESFVLHNESEDKALVVGDFITVRDPDGTDSFGFTGISEVNGGIIPPGECVVLWLNNTATVPEEVGCDVTNARNQINLTAEKLFWRRIAPLNEFNVMLGDLLIATCPTIQRGGNDSCTFDWPVTSESNE